LLTTKIQEESAEKIIYVIKSTLLLKRLPKLNKLKELSVSTMVNPMVEPGKLHLLIWPWNINRDSKEERQPRDFTLNFQFIDLEEMPLQKLQMISMKSGNNNWARITSQRPTNFWIQTIEAPLEWQKTNRSTTEMMLWASFLIEMALSDTTRWMEEVIQSLQTLEIQETCWKWLEETLLLSQREKDSMKTQKALSLSKDKNNKIINLQKRNWAQEV
jgi:hypothetical protein